ncbi:LysR family transcriptional regulator [Phyllobacterium brassicacearum]|uniref:LysR family transcriptional regulator n=1 Tax=Phyllobacterium brassicacearum TaxID=314235 RepID=A0A2P7BRQ6_9HYPH|nr:LysR family transcriptional regulator [Phyllobacterium brassicacearum]PSH69141.1 LysR family transcriptional regulator [Phyllobacterium brassicacearum]TDQ22641.1 LysR family transcriptional regulator [Phyllobacterium brassicacearum]
MKWRFDDLLTFLDVMETRSITATAARLNLSKSVVSKRISDLEAALGIELFQRLPRKLLASDNALDFVERIRPLVREIIEATDTVGQRNSAIRGSLRIAAPMTFGTLYLGRMIADFARQYPDLEVAVEFEDRMIDLVRGGYDVGIRIGILKDSSLIARKLCTDARVICCSPDFASANGLPKTVDELSSFACIDYSNVNTSQLWQFENPAGSTEPISVTMRGRIVANNGEAMRDMAIAGLGLVLLPMFIAADALRAGTLVPVLPEAKPLPYRIYAVYPPTRHVSAKVRAFVDHLTRHIGDPPIWQLTDTLRLKSA